jgi:hypothetical protein
MNLLRILLSLLTNKILPSNQNLTKVVRLKFSNPQLKQLSKLSYCHIPIMAGTHQMF